MYDHRAFGLTLRSCLPLPGPRVTHIGEPDVRIAYGPVASDLPDAVSRGSLHQARPHALLLTIDRVARYLVSDGRHVMIERHDEASDADVQVFLMGSVLGALLHQRKDLVLHGSVVDIGDRAIGFLGLSGSGKSTLAAAISRRGHRVVSDDLCVLRWRDDDGAALVQPGLPQMKLWLDALDRLDLSATTQTPLRHRADKRAIEMSTAFASQAVPLARLYVLQPADVAGIELTPIEGSQKFQTLMDHTYRLSFVEGLGIKPAHFQRVVRLARETPMAAVRRPRDVLRLDELVDALVADIGSR